MSPSFERMKEILLRFESKKKLKIVFIILLFLFYWHGYASASTGEGEIIKIKTFISKSGIHPGDIFKVALLVQIKPNWHIHAHELSEELLIPTKLIFEKKEKIEVVKYYYPEPKLKKYDYWESELQVYDEQVILGALIKTSQELQIGQHKLKGNLKYQACDDTSCRPPKKIELGISFEVLLSSQETKDIHPEIFSKLDFEKGHNKTKEILSIDN